VHLGGQTPRALPHFMNETLAELIRQSPIAAALLGAVYLFLRREKEAEELRVKNAEALENKRQTHEITVNAMWASYIKNILDTVTISNQKIVDALAAHEKSSEERYERLGITQDLIDAVKAASHGATKK
jgi:hypothetical protein